LNILFITHYSALYGANRSLLLLLQGLKKKNINPLVLIPKDGLLIKELERLDIPYFKFRFWSWMGVRSNFFFIKSFTRFFINILILPILLIKTLKFKPSIIYTNSSTIPAGIYLASLLKLPHIWHVRELGKLDYNLEYDFGKKYFEYFMRKSAAIICISEFVRENLFKEKWDNVSVINNAVFSEDELNNQKSIEAFDKKETFTFLIMSVIHPSKGIQDAIEALAKIHKTSHNVKLIICGGNEDKEYSKYLDELVLKLDLVDCVSFMGFVEKPAKMYNNSNAVLVCSRNEAWGRVAAEAMIFEKPVIGYKSGGTKEIITNNVNGLLYSNIEELVNCMKTVINDKEFVNKITVGAKKFAIDKYSQSAYVENVLQIISKVKKKDP